MTMASCLLWWVLFLCGMRHSTGYLYSNIIQLIPHGMDIVLVGHASTIKVICEDSRRAAFRGYAIAAHPHQEDIIQMVNAEISLYRPPTNLTSAHLDLYPQFRLIGLKAGRTYLDLDVIHAGNKSLVGPLVPDYQVLVVEKINVLRDVFIYVLLTSQVLTLLLLAFRMRAVAIKEVLCSPCALLAAIFCQAILMPLVSIGISLSLSLPIHAVVCLLILGCCPTGLLSSMMAVVHQSHVELSIVLTLLETTTAFGIMPLWLFTYGNFLGLTYDRVSGPYFYIAGALLTLSGPLLAGLLIQRCSPRALPRMDRAILPTCGLMLLVEIVINAINFKNTVQLVTWRLLLGSSLVPLSGFVLGIVTTATFKQRLPQIKTVAIVTAVQNTVLAKVIIQMSYPAADASVMAVTLSCVDFFTLCLLLASYLPHIAMWFCWPFYRRCHDHVGIGGLDHSIGETLVRSMIKAGEITFGKLQQSPKVSGSFEYPTLKPSLTLNTLNTLASLSGKHRFYSSEETIYKGRSSNRLSRSMTFPINYFATTEGSPGSEKRSDRDSLEGIDYDMLMLSKKVLSQRMEYDILMPSRSHESIKSIASTVSSCVEKPVILTSSSDIEGLSPLPPDSLLVSKPSPEVPLPQNDPGSSGHVTPDIDSGLSSDNMSPSGQHIRKQWLATARSKWAAFMGERPSPSPPQLPALNVSGESLDLSSITEEGSYQTAKIPSPDIPGPSHADHVGLLAI